MNAETRNLALLHRPVAVQRRLRLELELRYFGFGLFCVRCSRRSRHSPEALALTWAS